MTSRQFQLWCDRVESLDHAVSALGLHARREEVLFCCWFADQLEEVVERWRARLAMEEERVSHIISPSDELPGVTKRKSIVCK